MIKGHNRKYYVLIGIGIFLILILSVFVFILMPRGKPVILHETNTLYEIVEDGDIICRLGDRFWSQLFKDLSTKDKRYSHMGIIRVNNGLITVIHAEGDTGHGKDFVHEVTLEEFIKIARAIGIYRINDVDRSKISGLAIEYMGIPFDWQFDMNDESKLYCTELLYVILKRIKPVLELNTAFIKELGNDIISLEAISNSEHFSEIYFISNSK
jgi:hypothetical protein